MKTSIRRTILVLSVALAFVSGPARPAGRTNSPRPAEALTAPSPPAKQDRLSKSNACNKLPLAFEENRGQTDDRVKYLCRGRGYSFLLNAAEAIVNLRRPGSARATEPERRARDESTSISFRLVGSNRTAEIKGADELSGSTNYFIGNDPRKWRTNVRSYAKLICSDAYDGVDLVYYGNQRQLEYDLIVAPGVDPAIIRLAFDGEKRLHIDALGNLVLDTQSGSLVQHRPIAYQEENGVRREVPARYVLTDAGQVSFEIGRYDTSKSLVIDPVLSYSTYLGGGEEDEANGIAVDSEGNTYVTGATASDDFPAAGLLPSGRSTTLINTEVFITKLNPAGTEVIYSTYLGGVSGDEGYGIAVDSKGNAYVTGNTFSSDFPTSGGAFQTRHAGLDDAFVAKISPAGDTLLYSTFLGGTAGPFFYFYNTGSDIGFSIAVDSAGSAYVTGRTFSSDFPTKKPLQATINSGSAVINAAQPPPNPVFYSDAFVSKLDPAGKNLVYSTYLGGSRSDEGRGIAIDASGSAYVVGFTESAGFGSPGTLQPAFGGGPSDAFVTKLGPSGRSVVFSTWLGGSESDKAYGVAVDGAGNCYVTGETDSPNFPSTPGALGTGPSGGSFYRSTNGGTTWSRDVNGLTATNVDHVVIDPTDANTVYAASIGRYPTFGGMFKSTDGGANFSAADRGLPRIPNLPSIAAMVIDPKNPSTLYVLTIFSVFKTTDGGNSWNSTGNSENLTGGQLTIDPIETNTLYASKNLCPIAVPEPNAGASASQISPLDAPPQFPALLKTTDAGATWKPTGYPDCLVGPLVIDSKNPATIYSSFSGGLKSTDGGNNWRRKVPSLFATILAVDPSDSSIVYAAQGSNAQSKLLISTDTGETWKDAGLSGVGIHSIAIDSVNPSIVYAGTGNLTFSYGYYDFFLSNVAQFGFGGGVFKSTDRGATWNLTSLDGAAIKKIVISPSNPSVLYAGALKDSDVFVTKINATGSAIMYSTYLGGTGRDVGYAIAVDAAGNAYVTGQTYSSDFLTREAIQSRRASGPSASGAFAAKVNSQGQALIYSTHLGGSGDSAGNGDVGRAIAVDQFGKVYVAGVTASSDFPVRAALQRDSGGEEDAFVAKLALPPRITGASISGKNLVLAGDSFDKDAVILVDGQEHGAKNDAANPSAVLIGKKLGKRIAPGQSVKLRVKNSDGELSPEFVFVRP